MDEETTGGLRERKKERVREQIVQTAIELFTRNGFEHTTIDDIVRKIDVSRRTFFRYFATKEDLLTKWLEDDRLRIREALEARPAEEGPVDAARHVFAYLSGILEAERETLLAVERIGLSCGAVRGRRQEKLESLAAELAVVFAARLGLDVRRDLRPRLLANLTTAAAQSAFDTWIAGGGRERLAALMDEALRYIDPGTLPTPPARRASGARPPRRRTK